MRHFLFILPVVLTLMHSPYAFSKDSNSLTASRATQLPPIPDKAGLAGAFSGTSHGALIVAGGANFPDGTPWTGGKKVWHDAIYVLTSPTAKWQTVGKLASPLAYGVSVSANDEVICIGGENDNTPSDKVFALKWENGKLKTAALPSLPKPISYACGALVGQTIYIAGGMDVPNATATSHTFYALDLKNVKAGWKSLPTWRGAPRMLAMAASLNGKFYLAGGVDLSANSEGKPERRYLKDAYVFTPSANDDLSANGKPRHWKKIADLPHILAGAPSPAMNDKHGFSIFGGDARTNPDTPAQKITEFSPEMLRYDAEKNQWTIQRGLKTSRATAPTTIWHGDYIIVNGERRPGIRSPEVQAFKLKEVR